MTNSQDSDERLDRLALLLGRTTQLLASGGTGVALKEQLMALQRALFDVVKDNELVADAIVQRNIETTRPVPKIPGPFRPVDTSVYAAAQRR